MSINLKVSPQIRAGFFLMEHHPGDGGDLPVSGQRDGAGPDPRWDHQQPSVHQVFLPDDADYYSADRGRVRAQPADSAIWQ